VNQQSGSFVVRETLLIIIDLLCMALQTKGSICLKFRIFLDICRIREWGGARIAQFIEPLRYKPEGRGLDFRWHYWDFFSLNFDCVPGVYTASNKNSIRDTFWEKKRTMCRTDNLATFMSCVSRNSANLNLLEP
jgi:hypothetical protein